MFKLLNIKFILLNYFESIIKRIKSSIWINVWYIEDMKEIIN